MRASFCTKHVGSSRTRAPPPVQAQCGCASRHSLGSGSPKQPAKRSKSHKGWPWQVTVLCLSQFGSVATAFFHPEAVDLPIEQLRDQQQWFARLIFLELVNTSANQRTTAPMWYSTTSVSKALQLLQWCCDLMLKATPKLPQSPMGSFAAAFSLKWHYVQRSNSCSTFEHKPDTTTRAPAKSARQQCLTMPLLSNSTSLQLPSMFDRLPFGS